MNGDKAVNINGASLAGGDRKGTACPKMRGVAAFITGRRDTRQYLLQRPGVFTDIVPSISSPKQVTKCDNPGVLHQLLTHSARE